MGRSEMDIMILSYNDAVLRQSDLDILSGPYFLNDRIIDFYFSYLSSNHPSEDVLLVSPSIAFCLSSFDTESLKDFIEPLRLPDKKLVIFPFNNNEDVNLAEGGSHWSLLAYHRGANVCVHHDSDSGTNKRHAFRLYETVVKYMGPGDAEDEPEFVELTDSPQQTNGYDCGLYVLAITGAICGWNESCDRDSRNFMWLSVVKEEVTPGAVTVLRNIMLLLIRSLMKENKACPSQKTGK